MLKHSWMHLFHALSVLIWGGKSHYTREISKSPLKLLPWLIGQMQVRPLSIFVTRQLLIGQGPLWSDSRTLRVFGKQANLNTSIFSRAMWPTPWGTSSDKKVRNIRRTPRVICELMRINAHSNSAVLSFASLMTMSFANADNGKLPLREKAIH